MRTTSIAASLVLAVCIATSSLVTSSFAASDNPVASTAPTVVKKRRTLPEPLKRTWDQCFEMSITRGFNHDIEEWHQSVDDCMAGKIPL